MFSCRLLWEDLGIFDALYSVHEKDGSSDGVLEVIEVQQGEVLTEKDIVNAKVIR